jgi:hypothetical protein
MFRNCSKVGRLTNLAGKLADLFNSGRFEFVEDACRYFVRCERHYTSPNAEFERGTESSMPMSTTRLSHPRPYSV